jgi:IclR family transcriptional regulator, pca regulon regulatory protein
LAGLDTQTLDDRLARIEFARLTATTVPYAATLRARVDGVREAGWATVDQELEQGVRSAAVPIRDSTGTVAAALNVSVHATRMTMQALRRDVVPRLLRTAEAIEVDLRVAGAPSSETADA